MRITGWTDEDVRMNRWMNDLKYGHRPELLSFGGDSDCGHFLSTNLPSVSLSPGPTLAFINNVSKFYVKKASNPILLK